MLKDYSPGVRMEFEECSLQRWIQKFFCNPSFPRSVRY